MVVNPLPDSPSARAVSRKRINSRNKGNTYERWLARYFRDKLGHQDCRTTRQASRLLDNCGIDFSMLPYNISAKTGYKSNRPKPERIFQYIREKLMAHFPADDPVHQKPTFLFHKLDGKRNENHIVSMTFEDWVTIIKVYNQYKDQII